MNYEDLINLLVEYFKTGVPKNITADKLREALIKIVEFANVTRGDYQGTALPSTDPGTPSTPVYYFAGLSGTYTNFGGIVVDATEGINILSYSGSAWSKAVVPIDLSAYATKTEVVNIESAVAGKSNKVPGKNLFNIDDPDVQPNRFISSTTGSVMVGNSNYAVSGFIPVESGESYALSYTYTSAWYDENKEFISGQGAVTPVVAPEGAKFIRVTTNNTPNYQIEIGEATTSFEPFVLKDLKDFAEKQELSGLAPKALFGTPYDIDFLNTFQVDIAGEESPIFSAGSASWQNTGSTFSGWGTPIGMPQNFNAVMIRVRARAVKISQIRFRIYEVDPTGPVLVDKTIDVSVDPGESKYIVCFFDEIANSSGTKLYLSYNCDQLSDRFGISSGTFMPVEEGYGNPRYMANGSLTANGSQSTNGVEKTWVNIISGENVIGFTEEALSNLRKKLGLAGFTPSAEILMPSRIYATEGVQCNIFWDNVIFSNFPISKLNIDVTCTLGAQNERGWRYTPTGSAANANLTVTVYFDGFEIATATSVVVTKSASEGAGSKKILCIGDSTTAGGQYVSIINTDFGANPSVTFLGTQGSGSNKHEGHSGKTFAWFMGSESPFWNGSAISVANYLSSNGWTMAATDLVSIHLGINDVFSSISETKLNQIKSYCDALIANIRSAVPDINIAICVTIPPAISQDAFGSSYQNGQTLGGYLENYRTWVRFLLSNYDTAAMRTNKIFMPQFNCNVDRTYNFPQVTEPANSRTDKTITRWTNGVHPANEGYYQMGDVLWSFIKSL